MILLPFHLWFREVAGELSAGWGVAGSEQERLLAFVGLALRFHTGQALDTEGMEPEGAAALTAALGSCAATPPETRAT